MDLAQVAAETDGFVGADLAAACREAATTAVREHVCVETEGEPTPLKHIVITQDKFEAALKDLRPVDGDLDG